MKDDDETVVEFTKTTPEREPDAILHLFVEAYWPDEVRVTEGMDDGRHPDSLPTEQQEWLYMEIMLRCNDHLERLAKLKAKTPASD